MAPLDGALAHFEEAGLDRIRAKSLAMTDFLMLYLNGIGTPREPERRGGHVSLVHPAAQPMSLALRARGVIPDFRKPDVIRLAPSPLYNTFTELWDALQIMREIVETRSYERFASTRSLVT